MIELVFSLIGLSIQLIFLYRREMLTDKKFENWIWLGTVLLFIIGFALSTVYGNQIKTLPALMVPLMSYIIYRLLFWSYVSAFKQEPIDTFWSMNIKLMRPGVFNFLFWATSVIVPIIVAFKILK